jgi:hypothetical protein
MRLTTAANEGLCPGPAVSETSMAARRARRLSDARSGGSPRGLAQEWFCPNYAMKRGRT